MLTDCIVRSPYRMAPNDRPLRILYNMPSVPKKPHGYISELLHAALMMALVQALIVPWHVFDDPKPLLGVEHLVNNRPTFKNTLW